MRKKMFVAALGLLLTFCLIVGCADPSTGGGSKPEQRTGRIKLSVDPSPDTRGRGINLSNVDTYKITITGQGVTPVEEEVTPSELLDKYYIVNFANNVIVKVQPLDSSKQPVMGDACIYGYGNVTLAGDTYIDVKWSRTPYAMILEKLLAAGYDIHNYTNAALRNAISTELDAGLNPLIIDVNTIATAIQTNAMYAVVDKLSFGTVNGVLQGYTENTLDGLVAMINEPFAAPALIDKATGNYSFNNIAPGTWRITFPAGVNADGYVTVDADGTVTPDPLLIVGDNFNPVIYRAQISTFNDNDIRKAIFTVMANDEDGLEDINTVKADINSVTTELYDSGSGLFTDTVAGDGIYTGVGTVDVTTGDCVLTVIDNKDGSTDNTSRGNRIYLTCPELVSPLDNQGIESSSPFIEWKSVSGASYYSLFVYNSSGTLVASYKDITQTSQQISEVLGKGVYTLELYASYNKWPVVKADEFAILYRVSLTTIRFDVITKTLVDVNLPEPRMFYYSNELKKDIVAYDRETGQERVVFNNGMSNDIYTVSPDGQDLLISTDSNKKLYKVKTSNGASFMLANYKGNSYQIKHGAWSPDGMMIAYSINSGSYNYLQLRNSDGSNERSIGSIRDKLFVFSRDSKYLYFVRSNDKLSSYNIATGEIVELITISSTVDLDLSPDGERFIVARRSTIYTVNIDGTGYKSVYSSTWSLYHIRWLSDNEILYYNSGYDRFHVLSGSNFGQNRQLCTMSRVSNVNISPSGKYIYLNQTSTDYMCNSISTIDGTQTLLFSNNDLTDHLRVANYTW